jgi:NAD(P)-dependent dehydrogenase (short-subunit alcohol dehydrogenase family)
MSSVAGLVGGRVGVAYYASKHGVVGMTKAAALEYADKGIRINAVAPAVIKTPLTGRRQLPWGARIDSSDLLPLMTPLPHVSCYPSDGPTGASRDEAKANQHGNTQGVDRGRWRALPAGAGTGEDNDPE